ncbi:hypothetical protein ABT352_33050 [Streptosporangium sp. NPDC000563]|uniref:hypothetical protein n=1 Tax=Streptosporangium sp. NPDC000563 TaxID=3154366 RepID=UPI003322009F
MTRRPRLSRVRAWAWRRLDAVAHFVYCPAMLGRRWGRWHWSHDIHLIPGSWLEWVCAHTDRTNPG